MQYVCQQYNTVGQYSETILTKVQNVLNILRTLFVTGMRCAHEIIQISVNVVKFCCSVCT